MGFFNELRNVFHAIVDTSSGSGELSKEEQNELNNIEAATNKKIVVPIVEIDHKQAQNNSNNTESRENEGKGEK